MSCDHTERMIQVSMFRSSHGASWSYHRLELGVFALLCLQSSESVFFTLYTIRHLHELKYGHERTKRVKIWKRRRRPTDRRMRFSCHDFHEWKRLLDKTTTTKQNPRLKLQQEWPEKTTKKLTTTTGIIWHPKIGQWCHIFHLSKNLQQVLGSNFRLKIIGVVISAISTIYHPPPKSISWF